MGNAYNSPTFAPKRTYLSLALFTALALPGAGYAQSAPETAKAATANKDAMAEASNATAIETIVVTARKRSEELQSVPVAVSAFTADYLSRANIEGAADLQFSVPSAILVGGDTFTIRGIGNGSLGGDAGVGVFLNGASFGPLSQDHLYDIARVEVLRGPQGTLFGRNTTGGAITVMTKRPTSKNGGELILETGNYNERKITGVINYVFSPMLQQRFAGYKYDRSGFTKNTFTGSKIDGRDQGGFRSSTRLLIGDDTSANMVLGAYREDSSRTRETKRLCKAHPVLGCDPNELGFDSPTYARTVFNSIMGASGIPAGTNLYAGVVNPANPREVNADTDPRFKLEQQYATLDVAHETENYSFTYIGGYAWSSTEQTTDWDNAALPYRFAAPRTYNLALDTPITTNEIRATDNFFSFNRSTSHELRASSKYSGPFNFTLGAFYLDTAGNGGFLAFHPLIEGLQRALGRAPETYYVNTRFRGNLKTSAVFGEVNFKVSNALRLSVGARQTHEDRNSISRSIVLAATAPELTGASSASKGTGRVTVDYSLSPNNFVYGSIATGYKGGGFNAGNTVNPTFKPEEVTAYEFGSKNTFAAGTVQANFTAFYNDYKNMQLGQRINGTTLTSNANAKTKGAEAEFVWAPVKAVLLDANVSFLNTRIGQFLTVDAANPAQSLTATTPQVPVSLEGNALPYSPKTKYKIGAQYTAALFNSGWMLSSRVDHLWQDTYFAREFNTPTDKIAAWSVTNLQFRMFKSGGNLTLKAYVKNLANKNNITRIVIEDALLGSYRNARYLDPRTAGVAIEYQF
jgi:iron complex outermembrane recepter protein